MRLLGVSAKQRSEDVSTTVSQKAVTGSATFTSTSAYNSRRSWTDSYGCKALRSASQTNSADPGSLDRISHADRAAPSTFCNFCNFMLQSLQCTKVYALKGSRDSPVASSGRRLRPIRQRPAYHPTESFHDPIAEYAYPAGRYSLFCPLLEFLGLSFHTNDGYPLPVVPTQELQEQAEERVLPSGTAELCYRVTRRLGIGAAVGGCGRIDVDA